MNNVEAEAILRSIFDQVVAVYRDSVAQNPDEELMVLHIPGEPDFPLPLPVREFQETVKNEIPDLYARVEGGVPEGCFLFAIVETDGESTSVFVRSVDPNKPRALTN